MPRRPIIALACAGGSMAIGVLVGFQGLTGTAVVVGALGVLAALGRGSRAGIVAVVVACTVAAGATRLIPSIAGVEITSMMVGVVALLGIADRAISRTRASHRQPTTAIEAGAIVLLAGAIVAALGNGTETAVAGGALRMVQHVTVLLAISTLEPCSGSIRTVVRGLVAGMVVQCGVGLYELMSGATVFYSRWKPLQAALWDGFLRVASTPADPNYFALGLVSCLPIVFHMMSEERGRWRAAFAAVFIVMLLLLVVTFSRAGYVGALVVIALGVWRSRASGRRRLLVIGGLVAAAIVIVGSGVGDLLGSRVASIALGTVDASIRTRLAAQQTAIHIFLQRPILGLGFDQFVSKAPEYLFALSGIATDEINVLNSFLLVAVEGGIVSIGGFFLMVFGGLRSLGKTFTANGPYTSTMAVFDALVAFAVVSLTLDGLHSPIQWILFGLGALSIRTSWRLHGVSAASGEDGG